MTEFVLTQILESLQEIKACASMYADNYCADKPSPIIVHQCHEWKTCMERDASIVGRTKLLAELIGEVINSFMEPITWRTLVNLARPLAMTAAYLHRTGIHDHVPLDGHLLCQHPACVLPRTPCTGQQPVGASTDACRCLPNVCSLGPVLGAASNKCASFM